MKFNWNMVVKISLGMTLCLAGMGLALAQQPPTGSTGAAAPSKRPGMDPRVQNRTYTFSDTSETLPYAVFVSSKVSKDKKAPLIMALRGAGGSPTYFMQKPALDLAEEGGYILVGAMGYRPMGSFGMPAGNFGGGGMAAGGNAAASSDKTSEYSEKDVMNVLDMVRKEFKVDDQRVYLMGHSQGGAGALFLGGKYSTIWAAVAGLAPGAPGFQFDTNSKVKELPLLIMVGAKDSLIGSVQRLDATMKSANIAHEYKEVPGLDHGGIVMGAMPDVFKFFGEHTKAKVKDGKTSETKTKNSKSAKEKK
jgi:predicted esterase